MRPVKPSKSDGQRKNQGNVSFITEKDPQTLVVDDDKDVCDVLGQMISGFGIRVETTSRPLEVLDLVRNALTICFYPLSDGLARNTKYLCNFDLLLAIQNSVNCLSSKLFLSNRSKRTSIISFHTRIYKNQKQYNADYFMH